MFVLRWSSAILYPDPYHNDIVVRSGRRSVERVGIKVLCNECISKRPKICKINNSIDFINKFTTILVQWWLVQVETMCEYIERILSSPT